MGNIYRKKYFFTVGLVLFLVIGVAAQQVSAEEAYATNSPGVVMVQTVFSANVYVNKVVMDERKFDLLVDSVRKLDTSGSMFTAEDKLDMVVKALYKNPFRFFSRTTQYLKQQHRIVSTGTGFFITGNGYLVTNSHILDRDSEYIRRKFILSTYEEVTNANIRSLETAWEIRFTDEQRALLNNAYSLIYSQVSSMILNDLKREIFIQSRVDRNGEALQTLRMPARIIIKGRSMPGKDVAILKVDNVSEMPVLSVARDSITRIGERVWVYGYPEPVTSNLYLARETSSEPTLTEGIVSAVKKSIGGWPVIQMDAAITHGSSGSPVSNISGEVIGLATFGSLEQSSGKLSEAYNFAIPVSIVRQFLDSAKVVPAMSQSSLAYNRGVKFFNEEFYGKALQQFQMAQKLNPDYPLVSSYITQSEKFIHAGLDKDTFLQKIVFRIMAVVIIIGGGIVFYRFQLAERKRS
ncbi:MAG: trypsin-like peptidase domain-containing protein [Chitinophagaceae bacterium]